MMLLEFAKPAKYKQICLLLSREAQIRVEPRWSKARAETLDVFGVSEHA